MTETGRMETADQSRRRRLPAVFPSLAYLFSPANGDIRSGIIQADARWRVPRTDANVAVVLWGRLPRNERPSIGLLPQAARREAAIARLRFAPPRGLRLADLHRLPPVRRPGRLRGPIRVATLSGVLAELVRGQRPVRVIDAVIEAAGGLTLASAVRPSGDGSALATIRQGDGSLSELRTSKVGHPKDPERGRAALLALENADVPLVPRPLRSGVTAGAAWATETILPGAHTVELTPGLLREIVDLLVRLPSEGTPARAVDDQLREVGLAFPSLAERLDAVAAAVRRWSSGSPSVLVHGDLWINNVLITDGQLSGVFDWDTWHPAGVPGSDLLNLLAAEERTRSRRDFGPLLIRDYWRSAEVLDAYAPYMAGRGLAMPDLAGQAAIGVAWWASRLEASLDRGGRPTDDPDWVARNLVEPLDRLERLERDLG